MTEKLTGGEWMTRWEKIRWHLIRLLLRKDDTYLLAEGMSASVLDNSLDAEPEFPTKVNPILKQRQMQRYQLYYVLRWMQRNPKT